MLKQIQDWFGMSPQGQSLGLGHGPNDGKGHGHTHGSIDPTIATTTKRHLGHQMVVRRAGDHVRPAACGRRDLG